MHAVQTLLILCLYTASSSSQSLLPEVDVSRLESTESECNAALSALSQGLDTHQLWAHRMVDAGVKSPVGLLSQTLVQFGDFDECLGLDAPVDPQYCLFDILPAQPHNSSWMAFRWGLCVPAVCSVSALRHSLQTYMDHERGRQEVGVDLVPAACSSRATRTSSFDTVDIYFCVVMSAIVLLVIAVTVWEVMMTPDADCSFPPKTVLQCLSARQGLRILLHEYDQTLENVDLSTFYGLHTLPFLAIVAGHRFVTQYTYLILTNFHSILDDFENPWISIWLRADLLVDVFFFMSAFLLGLRYYCQLDKHFVNPCFVYAARISRILPAYAVTVFFAATVFRHLGDGPLWHLFVDGENGKCRDNWWANLLFIHNYVNVETLCLINTWYISCDVQLFVIGTLLVLLLHKSPLLGALVTVLVFIASTVARFVGVYSNDLIGPFLMFDRIHWGNEDVFKVFNTVYSQGHYRGTSYIVGLLTGIYVYRRRDKPLTKIQTYIMESLGIALFLGVYWSGALFHGLTEPRNLLLTALYAAFNHSFFGFGLALIIVSWTLGHKTPLSRLFSWKGFVPLSKLSFSTFLFSLISQYAWLGSVRAPIHYDFREMISWTAGDIIFSMLAGLVVYLTIETPIRYLFKHLTSSRSSKPEV